MTPVVRGLSLFLYETQCWTFRKEDAHDLFTAEIGRLRNPSSASRRQRKEGFGWTRHIGSFN